MGSPSIHTQVIRYVNITATYEEETAGNAYEVWYLGQNYGVVYKEKFGVRSGSWFHKLNGIGHISRAAAAINLIRRIWADNVEEVSYTSDYFVALVEMVSSSSGSLQVGTTVSIQHHVRGHRKATVTFVGPNAAGRLKKFTKMLDAMKNAQLCGTGILNDMLVSHH